MVDLVLLGGDDDFAFCRIGPCVPVEDAALAWLEMKRVGVGGSLTSLWAVLEE